MNKNKKLLTNKNWNERLWIIAYVSDKMHFLKLLYVNTIV